MAKTCQTDNEDYWKDDRKMNKSILVISPTTHLKVRKRLIEVAHNLSYHYRVFLLHWHEPQNERLLEKIKITLRDIFKGSYVYEKEGFLLAEYPLFHRPLFMIKCFNPCSLEKFLIKYHIDVVINGIHYFFPTPISRRIKYKHIFDVNDLPVEKINTGLDSFMYEFVKKEVQKADVVTACSTGLVEYIRQHFGRKAHLIPNGTYLEQFRQADWQKVREIRSKYNLQDKFVIGYIGYVGEWIDIDFLIRFFKVLKRKYANVALMVIGSGPTIDLYKSKIVDKDIIFTGGIRREQITPYFFAIDVGILPSKKNLFQDLAFHIKLIEYTAAKKMVVSSPLEEVKRLGFPNIFTANLNIEEWVEMIEKIRSSRWDQSWDNLVDDYDWQKIGQKFIEIIEGSNA